MIDNLFLFQYSKFIKIIQIDIKGTKKKTTYFIGM